jgi:hypothetical protein
VYCIYCVVISILEAHLQIPIPTYVQHAKQPWCAFTRSVKTVYRDTDIMDIFVDSTAGMFSGFFFWSCSAASKAVLPSVAM